MNLKAIKERCDAATPGPWYWDYDTMLGSVEADACYGIIETDGGVYPPRDNDREFIAHARTDLPELLAWVENARLVLEAVEIPVPTPDTPGFSDAFNLSEIQRALLAELGDAEMEK